MTIRELKHYLSQFDDDTKDAFIYEENTHIMYDIESVSDNNGHLQLNTEKEYEEQENIQ